MLNCEFSLSEDFNFMGLDNQSGLSLTNFIHCDLVASELIIATA